MTKSIDTLIQEEYNRVQLIQNIKTAIHEQETIKSWADKKFPAAKAERILKLLPDTEQVKQGDYYIYRVELRKKTAAARGGVTDKLTFYPNGEVYSLRKRTMYTYTYTTGDIEIFDKQGAKQGDLETRQGENFIGLGDTDIVDGGTWVDTLQTVLDWAGLVPVIGDFIDIINAIIYFVRQKWFDGVLSAIAVIPVVGSVLKLGIKNIGKPVAKLSKGLFVGSKTSRKAATDQFWQVVSNSGVITKDVERVLLSGLDEMGAYLNKTLDVADDFNFKSSGFETMIKQIDEFFVNSKKAISKTAPETMSKAGDLAKKFSDEQMKELIRRVPVFRITAEEIAENPGFFKRAFSNFTLNPTKMRRLKGLFNINPKKLDDIALHIKNTFDQKLLDPKNASDLMLIAKSMPYKQLEAIKVGENFDFARLMLGAKRPIALKKLSSELSKLPPEQYKDFATNIINLAKDNGNLVYHTRLANSGPTIKSFIDPKEYVKSLGKDKQITATIANMYKDYVNNIKFLGSKQLDIWSNEVQDIFDEMGMSSDNISDNYDSVFSALVISAIKDSVGSDEAYQAKKESFKKNWAIPIAQLISLFPFVDISIRSELGDEIYMLIPGDTHEEKVESSKQLQLPKNQEALLDSILNQMQQDEEEYYNN